MAVVLPSGGMVGSVRWAQARRVVVMTSLLLGSSWVQAQAPVASSPAVLDDGPHDPRAWLMRTHEAASNRSFQGTLVMSTAEGSSSSRVFHLVEAGEQYERVDWLDGAERSQLRHNETVHTLWPNSKVALVEQREPRAVFPALLSGGERRVLQWYELRRVGVDRVAGLEADVVLMQARDALRFSQRLWADRRTGLLLRSDILSPTGTALESVAFSEIHIGVRLKADQVMRGLNKLNGYRVIRSQMLPTRLAAEGWALDQPPNGFKEVHCARRALDPVTAGAGPVVVQSIYSDGLTHVSLFIEPYVVGRHKVEAVSLSGATYSLTQRRGDYWVTVLGEVPPETLKRFVTALDRRR